MIEIHRPATLWMYRIDAQDDCHIQRRKLARGSKWQDFRHCESAEIAREVILVMEEELPPP
jgi:hypothetical protein